VRVKTWPDEHGDDADDLWKAPLTGVASTLGGNQSANTIRATPRPARAPSTEQGQRQSSQAIQAARHS